MRILKNIPKENFMKLKIESEEDLWHLNFVLEREDFVEKKTLRTSSLGREKVPCTLKIRVEKVSYEGTRLRVTGEIVAGPDNIKLGYHTFTLKENSVFSIWKEKWRKFQLERIKRASRVKKYKILVCLIEKEGCSFYLITERGIQEKGEMDSEISGKMYKGERSESEFFGEIVSYLRSAECDKIVLAGPGFEKENLLGFIKEREKELSSKVFLQDTSVTGRTGLNEVIKRGAIDRILKESRISKEILLVERFLELLGKNGRVAYGIEEVKRAVEYGAVKELLILDKLIKNKGIEKIMENVEKQHGIVHIISSDHDYGMQLESLGGIGAILRFKVSLS